MRLNSVLRSELGKMLFKETEYKIDVLNRHLNFPEHHYMVDVSRFKFSV